MCKMLKPITTLFLTTIVLFIHSFTVAFTDNVRFNPDEFCSYIKNNTKIKDPTACNKYITCVDQKPITGVCEGDLFYDRNMQRCVAPNITQCYSSNPCAVKPSTNGFLADPYSCNSYYYCQRGKGTQGFCSAGMNFNSKTKNCIRNYPCEVKILPEHYCNIVPDDVFIKVPSSCTAYQVCWHGKLVNGTCPDSFYFNALLGACDYPTNVNCEETKTVVPPIPHDIKCNQPGVFISDAISCNGYYYCKGLEDGSIELKHGKCPFLRFFDPNNGGACVLRSEIACIYNRCISLGYRSIQMANVNSDGCTGFLICQGGEIIGQSECPSGQYFDEMLQLCTTKLVAYPACVRAENSTTSLKRAIQSMTNI